MKTKLEFRTACRDPDDTSGYRGCGGVYSYEIVTEDQIQTFFGALMALHFHWNEFLKKAEVDGYALPNFGIPPTTLLGEDESRGGTWDTVRSWWRSITSFPKLSLR